MKILAATNFLRAGRAWWGKERGDRGLRGGDRGLEGRGEGVTYLGAGNFLERMLHQEEDLANLAVGCFHRFLFSKPFLYS